MLEETRQALASAASPRPILSRHNSKNNSRRSHKSAPTVDSPSVSRANPSHRLLHLRPASTSQPRRLLPSHSDKVHRSPLHRPRRLSASARTITQILHHLLRLSRSDRLDRQMVRALSRPTHSASATVHLSRMTRVYQPLVHFPLDELLRSQMARVLLLPLPSALDKPVRSQHLQITPAPLSQPRCLVRIIIMIPQMLPSSLRFPLDKMCSQMNRTILRATSLALDRSLLSLKS